ncbi:ras-related GTP-binding protein, putative [Bodo saltans]|uniref:Ras-related GTP-binding protein, putative n=1 Tax=Bodo saltans TaxID=75058 RepID=A0A0S4JVK4_BODSA|nr:ras-related GTP-binding protein, putative [Bodo saltans]|eukprot:CUG94254.1 ras-related GTP-binding protein, putative [Bodo saltans]
MSLDNVEDSIKVIVVGDGNVGKTSMLRRFVRGEFTDQYKKTIGAEFMEKEVFVRELNQPVTLMLWDTAGQEVFNALTASYYRGAGAAVLAFSTVDRDSFMNVEKWKQKVEAQCGSITLVLCQTKYDLQNEAAVSNAEAEALAIKLKVPFFRSSTKDNFNVSQLFEFTAKMCLSAGVGTDGGVVSMQQHATSAVGGDANQAQSPSGSSAAAQQQQAAAPTQQTQQPKESAPKEQKQEPAQSNTKPINMKDPAPKKVKKEKKSICTML